MLGILRRCANGTGKTVLGVAGLRVCQRADGAQSQDWCDRLAGLSSWRVGPTLTGGCRSRFLSTACDLARVCAPCLMHGKESLLSAIGEFIWPREKAPNPGGPCLGHPSSADRDAEEGMRLAMVTHTERGNRSRASRRGVSPRYLDGSGPVGLQKAAGRCFYDHRAVNDCGVGRVRLAQGQVRGRNRDRRGLGSLFSLGPYLSLPTPAGKHLALCIP